ncbi:hypothetical protein FB45DRAFT_1063991 [Roridomyces roridus]|uniref:GATA-type domain-containing protein n=1 Tax=Roridomyces roridus TaxID=1738132 RepID=A0AAD7FFA1_9AGAR|nr:hypothetical protein FB45DRAFT_1063991 [Roridomyces roridus]
MPPRDFAFNDIPPRDERGEENQYWRPGTAYGPALDHPGHLYPQFNLGAPTPYPSGSSEHYGFPSHPSTPSINFAGLIPMYGEADSAQDGHSRGRSMDLSYGPEWPTNMASYASPQQKGSSTWYPSPVSASAGFGPPRWGIGGSGGQYYTNGYAPSPYRPSSPSCIKHTSFPASSSTSSTLLPPPTRRRGGPSPGSKSGPDGEQKSCSHCKVTSTPLWRRDPTTHRTLCNACGLYLQQRNAMRPQALIEADIDDEEPPEINDEDYTGPKCSHCNTRKTSVWRRSKTGAQVCNACGVYARLRGQERPLSLRRNKIKPRSKHPPPTTRETVIPKVEPS